jgi:hypothetical protein
MRREAGPKTILPPTMPPERPLTCPGAKRKLAGFCPPICPHHDFLRGGLIPNGAKDVPSSLEESQFPGPGDRVAAGGGVQLAVDRLQLRLDGGRGNEQLGGDLGDRHMGGQQR